MRILLADVAARLRAQLDASIFVSTSYDRHYNRDFSKMWPAVWVVSQRRRPRDDARRYTGRLRQNNTVQIIVRPVVQKVADGETGYVSSEARLQVLEDLVEAALFGWKPPNAEEPLIWSSGQDGPAYETVTSSDLIFETWVTANRSTP